MGRYNNRLDGVCKLMKIIQKNNFSKNEWKIDGLSDRHMKTCKKGWGRYGYWCVNCENWEKKKCRFWEH